MLVEAFSAGLLLNLRGLGNPVIPFMTVAAAEAEILKLAGSTSATLGLQVELLSDALMALLVVLAARGGASIKLAALPPECSMFVVLLHCFADSSWLACVGYPCSWRPYGYRQLSLPVLP